MALSSYFMEVFQKFKLISKIDAYKSSLLILDDKSFVILLTYLY
jgi:hypothetical protein